MLLIVAVVSIVPSNLAAATANSFSLKDRERSLHSPACALTSRRHSTTKVHRTKRAIIGAARAVFWHEKCGLHRESLSQQRRQRKHARTFGVVAGESRRAEVVWFVVGNERMSKARLYAACVLLLVRLVCDQKHR